MMNHKKNTAWTAVLLVLVFVGLCAYAVHEYTSKPGAVVIEPVATTTIPVLSTIGDTSLKLGMKAVYGMFSIKPITLLEDSRCATGVQCIQAGTVRVLLSITTSTTTETMELGLNKILIVDGHKIAFKDASPYPSVDKPITLSDYSFTFNVTPVEVTTQPVTKMCYTGGCSGEVCSGNKDVASTCIYREEFACYKKATCEVQSTGQCGWTQTSELQMCIQKASSGSVNENVQ